MKDRIYLSPPHLSGEEIKYVQQAFKSNWIAPVGPAITEFERRIKEYNLIDYCAAVNSGTSAIHLALMAIGVKSGDEVICSTLTFSGSCNPIVYQSAAPVFVDSELETWNMDPELLEKAISDRIRFGKKPKAIILVHLFGMPAKMKEIMEIANRYEIPVIEDAAEALGSSYYGKKAGTIGDVGIYSFNGNKIITTSGGGAIVSGNGHWISRAQFLASQARMPASYYQHEEIGYNYQLSNICASIGLGQMDVLEDRILKRRSIFEFYRRELEGKVSFQAELLGTAANRWLTAILMRPGTPAGHVEKMRLSLESENIETRLMWKPMHLQPVFKSAPKYVNGTSELLFANGLCLPSGSNLTESDLGLIIEKLKRVL
ncbi:pyridoxal phosphate-dependent aminotransferase [Cytophagales bacterium WSM2-2]|nr:pyridoxal phosphate-dependent aminotransferase [Cytophagales bacterium WSM2-2]